MGCPAVGVGRYCPAHAKANHRDYNKERRADPVRRKADAFYSTKPWRSARLAQLQREPLCVECKRAGIITGANVVDHIRPISQGGAKFDPDNLQSMCKPCHDRKSVQEGSRFGNK